MTDAEKKLWYHLRARRLKGHKFRRQHTVENYIVDFACPTENLIVEVDGGQHQQQKEYDEQRTKNLKEEGYQVIRFWNDKVLKETERVLEEILRVLDTE